MCAVSAVGDDWAQRDKWPDWPTTIPWPVPDSNPPRRTPVTFPENGTSFRLNQLEKEVKALRERVLEMHEELRKARQQDIDEGNPDCEMEEKVSILKQIAELVGVDLKDVFPNG